MNKFEFLVLLNDKCTGYVDSYGMDLPGYVIKIFFCADEFFAPNEGRQVKCHFSGFWQFFNFFEIIPVPKGSRNQGLSNGPNDYVVFF